MLAATPGRPTLWRLTAQGAAGRPAMVRLRTGWRAAPARAAETRALRTALAALFPTEILVRRRQDLYALLYAAAEGEAIVQIPSVARPGSVFAGLRPVPGRGTAEIWDGGTRRARIEWRDIPPALLRLEMAHEGAPPRRVPPAPPDRAIAASRRSMPSQSGSAFPTTIPSCAGSHPLDPRRHFGFATRTRDPFSFGMETRTMRPILLLAALALAACAGARPAPLAGQAPAFEPVRNEAVFVGGLHGEALLFDLRRTDLDGGAAGAIDVEHPRAAHAITLAIEADGPFLLEARDAQGVRFRHAADGSDRLTLPARRGRIEFIVSPRGEGLTRIRAVAHYAEDLPPQGEPTPPRAAPRARVAAEPLLPPGAAPPAPLPDGGRAPDSAGPRP